ncbi:hypothetical protein QBC38DRAFT_522061 [Podospora fimiseda]|uniref:C2H2-type domain-containing protein n=1 Tax=Podospora fimiseda TaxID=252190 RepID=A0AAN6YMJ3_9PEZI|nr:hypothetical protein QBC38DRAFT_522061 [Podospora fimiseda]
MNDKPYRSWKDPTATDSEPINTKGAMLPPGYKKFDNAEFPWVCPVRSCRELFGELFGLGKHFNTSHRASRLNDNTDGTFTELGKYAVATAGDGVSCGGPPKPPIIVSKQPMTVDLPMPKPDLQRARVRASKSNQARQYTERTRTSTPAERTSTPTESSGGLGGLTMANPNRRYNQWTDDNGVQVEFQGIPVPEGYRYDRTVRGRPWICPIRSCRRLFTTQKDLSYHFKSTHRGSLLNDNLDGTFTVLKQNKYKEDKGIYVVSQGLMNTEPIVPPRVPTYPNHPKSITWVTPPEVSVSHSDLWKNICKEFEHIEDVKSEVKLLLKLAVARQVERPKPLDQNLTARQVTALLVQATGEVNNKPCSLCRRGDGPFGDCVSVPLGTAPEMLQHMNSQTLACANCLYRKEGERCSVKRTEWIANARAMQTQRNLTVTVEDNMDVDVDEAGAEDSAMESLKAGDKSWPDVESPQDHLGQSSSEDTDEILAELTASKQNQATRRVERLKRWRNITDSSSSGEDIPNRKRTKQSVKSDEGHVGLEDWEEGDGRIAGSEYSRSCPHLAVSTSVASKESFDFSSNSAVVDMIINPGTRHVFRAEAGKARCCLVTNGKLRVQIGHDVQFAVGVRGRFKIEPKVSCSVVNRSYENVFLTVISENLRR